MKESPTDDLFELIKSMSRTEKRYFTLDAKKGSGNKSNSYLKLFDALNGMDEYDEERLYKKLKGEPLLARLTTEKNYLYYNILKSMRNYWSDKSVYSRIKDMILNANYLLDRGLYEQSEKMLKKAKKLAKEYEQSASLLEINKLERTVYANFKLKSLKEKFEELVKEKDDYLGILSQELKFSDYKCLIFSEFSKQKRLNNPEKIHELKQKFPIEFFEENILQKAHPAYELFQSQCYYYLLLGEVEKAFQSKSKVIDWWEKNLIFKKEYFSKFIGDLMNYVSVSYSNKQFELIPTILNKIENEKPNSFHEERLVFETLALSKMLYYLNDGKFEEARNFVKEIEPGFKKYYIKKNLKTSIFGNFAILFFILSEFETCIHWVDRIIEHKKNEQRQDVQRYIRVLKIICLLELDKVDEFENACRSAIRYIEATTVNKQLVFEFEVIQRLKKTATLPLEYLSDEYKDFKLFLEEKKRTPQYRNVHGLDEYLFWINSKIAKSTILNWVKNQE